MSWTKAISTFFLFLISGCTIAPVDPTYISRVPADAQSFAVAQKAVRACYGENALDKFRLAGFGVSVQQVKKSNGHQIQHTRISSPDPDVYVLYHGNRNATKCYVGLKGMTPSQSSELAGIWVKAFDAKPNSEFGDGLSDHVSGAWRNYYEEPPRFPDKAAYYHRTNIAAYKTWPYGPYDPQKDFGYDIDGFFPEAPGAAVKLSYIKECRPHVSTGPRSGAFLPCSRSDFQPN